jgi:hypothetical protein
VLRAAHAEHAQKAPRRRAAALAFSVTVGLTAVLGVLIVGEVAQAFDARARGFALGVVVPGLAACLVIIIPWLETMSIVVGAGRSFSRSAKGRVPKIAWAMQLVLFGAWLFVFWSMGGAIRSSKADDEESDRPGVMRASLDRIGIAGISVMAALSGFAAVSTPWHTFLSPASRRPVSEAEIARKQAGHDAASEMLLTKRHRLQALEHKAAESSAHAGAAGAAGLVGKVLSSIRGASADETEIRALKMEISGLVTMRDALASGLAALERRRAEKVRSESVLGKVLAVPNYVFCVYCVYRVLATLMTAVSRAVSGWFAGAGAGSEPPPDPITRVLSLLTTHYDPTLDQAALSRQISFLLSGVILLLSLSSVLQTLTLLSRFAPRLLRLAQANLPLLLAQTLATYVFSSALLLRCNLPREASGVVGDALRSSLEPVFVEGWFQGWFLVGCAVTAGAIWIGRKVAGEDGWDDLGMEEMGQKRS